MGDCPSCVDTGWKPPWLPLGEIKPPLTIDDLYEVVTGPAYAHSGAQRHLEYLRSIAGGENVVELGMGGGDQSTCAFLAGRPKSLTSYDVNTPASYDTLMRLARLADVPFELIVGDTAESEPRHDASVLFVDSTHTAEGVTTELARFVTPSVRTIVLHDTAFYGTVGQDGGEGINAAINAFLAAHPEWKKVREVDYDNGLTTLSRI